MSKRIIIPILALAILSGCKTNENNYRQAYETARQKESAGLDSTVYNKIRSEARPAEYNINGENIGLTTINVTVTKGYGEPSRLKRYSTVVNRFQQSFNAKAMTNRLKANGYDAFIVNTSEPVYYVVAGSFDSKEEAIVLLHALSADSRMILKEPFPHLLEAAQLAH